MEQDITLSPQEAAELTRLCEHAGVVVIVIVSLAFVLSTTLCWYPCCRCALYLRETLVEKEALEGLLR